MAEYADTATAASTKGEDRRKTAVAWLDDIKKAEKDMAKWAERARNIERIWLEERSETKRHARQYAMLWANVSVLQPAVYAQAPQPAVTRRFSDRDPVARNVAEVMERSLTTLYDLGDINSCLKSVRDNFLVVGRGSAWVRYEPAFAQEQVESFDDDGNPVINEAGEPAMEEIETLKDEALAFDFVHWSDFVHPKARRWEDLPWVGRRVYLDDASGNKRFGEEKWAKAKAAYLSKRPGEYAKAEPDDRPCIYEVWSKADREVLWLAKDYGEEAMDRRPPLYDLRGFFPCPKPVYSTLPTDRLEPIPDYVYYQDQADEINQLTAKIGALEDALKLVGFYPAGAEGGISDAVEKALSPGTNNQMIPVPAWAAFVQGGGSKQMIEWLPVEQVVLVLRGCVELRRQLIDDVYQITGISDIIRGSTDPRETKGAQTIKAQWGSIRIRDRQADMARFCRDMTRISAEIVAEKFQPETLWRLSQLKFPTAEEKEAVAAQMAMVQRQFQAIAARAQQAGQQPPPMPPVPPQMEETIREPAQEEIIDLMRDDRLRSYRIDIETDSTIEPEEQAEKQSRQEFVTVLGTLIGEVVPVASQVPELVPVIGESLLFMARAYRAGRQLEDTIEQAVEDLVEKAKGSGDQPPPPDPRLEKIKADKEIADKRMQLDAAESQAKNEREARESAMEQMRKAREFAAQHQLDWAELTAEVELERTKIARQAALRNGFSQ